MKSLVRWKQFSSLFQEVVPVISFFQHPTMLVSVTTIGSRLLWKILKRCVKDYWNQQDTVKHLRTNKNKELLFPVLQGHQNLEELSLAAQ